MSDRPLKVHFSRQPLKRCGDFVKNKELTPVPLRGEDRLPGMSGRMRGSGQSQE